MIKKFHEYYVPVLKFLKENGPTHQSKLKEGLGKIENLTQDEINETSEKGTNIFSSRIHWSTGIAFDKAEWSKHFLHPRRA